ncbi:hypothetical protein HHK36_024423 [Tetracentron sinense]|uniref:K-box domain-containing protein n=1 Tax=Tetracentron sinense TaxID=13715 RepID=A0A834YKZ2_TETSI|nr:hypothetical protein HHK36_024423 [Tetracentron sinense]
MERILERYERYSYAERELVAIDPESQGNWSLEYSKLKAKIEVLQRNQRHFLGEDLNSLSVRELQNFEQQLDTALKHIRSRKSQLMYESISELQRKEKALQQQNNLLAEKLKEKAALAQQAHWEQGNQVQNPSTFLLSQSLPSLNIGGTYQARGTGGEDDGSQPHNRTNTLMPPWMLRHMNE